MTKQFFQSISGQMSFCLCVFFFNVSSFAQTTISGVISANAHWTAANSPYLVTANTLISDNVTLSIDPGVVVKIDPNVQISLRGKLKAHGTSNNAIRFMANGTSNWYGFMIDNTTYNPKVDLRFCITSDANTLFKVSSSGSTDTLLKFTSCTFNNHATVIDQYDGNKTHLVYIDSCEFTNISNYVNAGASNNIIRNSKFYGTYRAFYNNTSQNTVVENCEFSGYTSAALLINGTITNCHFFNNKIAICTMGTNSPIIKYNTINNNETGIEAWNYGAANSPTQINFNQICNNTIGVRKVYNSDTYVPNNCWCLSDSSKINAVVYDFFDSPNLGLIYFTPFQNSCTTAGPLGITNTTLNKSTLTLFPNPLTNAATLSLSLNSFAGVQIKLLDPLGHEIKTIFEGDLPGGSHEFGFAVENLSPGIYFLSIQTGRESVVKKIIKL